MIEARIEHVDPTTVAYVAMRGPYSKMPEAFGALYAWVSSHSFVPSGMPRAVYFTNPATTPEDEAVWELQTPLSADAEEMPPDEAGCGVRHATSCEEAVTLHRGPYELIEPTYRELAEWIARNGYTISGPPAEVYLTDPASAAPEDYLTEVRIPVQTS